jgi:hypothetical protein
VIAARTALAVGLLAAPLMAQERAPELSSVRVGSQIVVGTLATPVAFIAGGLAAESLARTLGASDSLAKRFAYAGAYTSVWLAAATVPAAIGRDGKYPAALAGSALGMTAAIGLVRLGNWRWDEDRRPCGPLCWALGAVVVALPSVGATIAYDRSRR